MGKESESIWQQREMYELVDSGSASTFHNAYFYADIGEGGLKIFFYILCLSCFSCLFDLL